MSDYTISGAITHSYPNDGVSEIHGFCHTADGAALNGMLLRVAWRGQPMVVEASSGPHPGYSWPPGYFSIPLFVAGKTPCVGLWDIWAFDPVRGIESARVEFATDGPGGAVNQLAAAFVWTPTTTPPPLPPTGDFHAWLLAEGEKEQVIQFNPNAALQKRIFADGFVPNSPEFRRLWQGTEMAAQRAERLSDGSVRVYYARVGQWDVVRYEQRG